MVRTGQILLRQIGGVITRRNSLASGRDLLEPLPALQQRAALRMLVDDYLAPGALALPPALQRRLAADFLDRQDITLHGQSVMPTNFSWAAQQLALQRMVLANLMNEALAERLLDNVDKTRDIEKRPLTPKELFLTLRQAIWANKAVPPAQASARRNLQRDHASRLASAVLANDSIRADARALLRTEASELLRQLRARPQGGDELDAAHRRDCIDTLSTALSASMLRQAP
jgi:hypothetical protein